MTYSNNMNDKSSESFIYRKKWKNVVLTKKAREIHQRDGLYQVPERETCVRYHICVTIIIRCILNKCGK